MIWIGVIAAGVVVCGVAYWVGYGRGLETGWAACRDDLL